MLADVTGESRADFVLTVNGAISRASFDAIVLQIREAFEAPILDRYRVLLEDLRAIARRFDEPIPSLERPATLAHVLRTPIDLRAIHAMSLDTCFARRMPQAPKFTPVRACERDRATRLRRDRARALTRRI